MSRKISLKTRLEIERLRLAAESLERVLAELGQVIGDGVTTKDLEHVVRLSLSRHGLEGVLHGFDGYPALICTSVNNVAAHGLPGNYVLTEGDLVTVDVSADRTGWKADAAWTYGVGKIGNDQRRLIRGAWRATLAGARAARAGRRVGDIGAAVSAEARKHGCSIVAEFIGHGIGSELHEDPPIPHVGEAGVGDPIVPGMVLNIEPVLTLGDGSVELLNDGWSYITGDGSLSAQYEVTVAVRADRTDILTLGRLEGAAEMGLPPYC
jgi:methionyl aminopeptidase